ELGGGVTDEHEGEYADRGLRRANVVAAQHGPGHGDANHVTHVIADRGAAGRVPCMPTATTRPEMVVSAATTQMPTRMQPENQPPDLSVIGCSDDDQNQVVTVLAVAHRRDAYRPR